MLGITMDEDGAGPAALPAPDRNSKEWRDLRDRAAYVHLTGSFPTHLRPAFTRALGFLTRLQARVGARARGGGSMRVREEAAAGLDLECHPMVLKVREFERKGYRIVPVREQPLEARRPYSRIPMEKPPGPSGRGGARITVQVDGSVLDGWP